MIPTPRFSKNLKIWSNFNRKFVSLVLRTSPNSIWGTLIFFPQHFMLAGLLFYIPEQDDRQIGISRFSALSGSTTLVVVVIVASELRSWARRLLATRMLRDCAEAGPFKAPKGPLKAPEKENNVFLNYFFTDQNPSFSIIYHTFG